MRGRRVVITGATSGLGRETARALAIAGADLVLAVRDVAAGDVVAAEVDALGAGLVSVEPLDLADLDAVPGFTRKLTGPVDVLIANAGVSETPESHLPSGLEVRFATNHLGHFLLAHELLEPMSERGARIVVLSSTAHKGFPVRLDDLNWRERPFNLSAYSESKTANILFAQEATRRWGKRGIFVNAVLPGSALTGLQRNHSDEKMRRVGFITQDGSPDPRLTSIGQAATTTVWAAVAGELEGRGGLVLENCGEAVASTDLRSWSGYDPMILDSGVAAALWDASLALLAEVEQRCTT